VVRELAARRETLSDRCILDLAHEDSVDSESVLPTELNALRGCVAPLEVQKLQVLILKLSFRWFQPTVERRGQKLVPVAIQLSVFAEVAHVELEQTDAHSSLHRVTLASEVDAALHFLVVTEVLYRSLHFLLIVFSSLHQQQFLFLQSAFGRAG